MNINQFLKKILKNKEIILIIILGFLLRIYKIKERFFWGLEQSLSLQLIVRLFEEKKLTLIGTHLFNYKSALFRPPFFIYIFAIPLKIFNFDPFALELIFVLISLLVILLIFSSAKIIFNKQTAIIASLLYSASFSIINIDKNIFTITPIIITSSVVFFLLAKLKSSKRKSFYLFLIGCLVGLGFSFHFQAAIILTALTLLFLKTKGFKKTVFFFVGIAFFLLPLLIFNLKHDFIMFKGVKNLFFGGEVIVRENQDPMGKLNNALSAFSDLSLSILNLSFIKTTPLINVFTFIFLFLTPALFIYKQSNSARKNFIIIYFLLSCFSALLSLAIIDQGFYRSTAFYIWLLIPLLLTVWAQFLFLIGRKRKIIIIVIMFLFFLSNFRSIIKQKPGNYQKKVSIVDYILKSSEGKKFSLKFINKDVLAYDYLFYYRAPFYQLTFNDINLIEQWNKGKANFFLIHGDYDWEKDEYQIKPFTKKADFNGVIVVVK